MVVVKREREREGVKASEVGCFPTLLAWSKQEILFFSFSSLLGGCK